MDMMQQVIKCSKLAVDVEDNTVYPHDKLFVLVDEHTSIASLCWSRSSRYKRQ